MYYQWNMADRDLYLTEKIKNIAYNAKYKALSFFQEYNKERLIHPNEEIFILGQQFAATEENVDAINRQIYEIFENTIWITYRSGFPQLPNELVGSYISDTGWGCMVRVGQMLFAQIIKHHQGVTEKNQIKNILSLFNDVDKRQPFSIQNISRLARIQYGLKPGDWYNPSQISFILSQLHEKYLSEEMHLKFNVFNSGNLFFDSVAESMLGQESQCICEKPTEEIVCPKCNK